MGRSVDALSQEMTSQEKEAPDLPAAWGQVGGVSLLPAPQPNSRFAWEGASVWGTVKRTSCCASWCP